MKRLTLLLLGLALGVTATANAQGLTMQMSNGWSFSFAGNVNAFWVFSKATQGGPTNSSIRTGLLPAFATFEARGKEAGMNLAIHFGFAPQINNGNTTPGAGAVHDNFGNGTQAGAQIDMRQVYLTFGGQWGQILAGRELALFGRQNILNDQTLFGVGAVGVGGGGGGGTTLGRIGYGYLYPNFNAQVTYSTRPGTPAQLSIGLFQPSVVLGTNYNFTKVPRLEAELTWSQKSGKSKYTAWAGGLWQSTSTAPDTGGHSLSSVGGTVGVRGDFQELSVVVSGYISKGLGNLLEFNSAGGGSPVAANDSTGRPGDGGYVQVGYTFNKKTTLSGSWGFSRLKNASSGEGAAANNSLVRTQWTSYTVGIYHQWTRSMKLVFEGTREQEGVGGTAPAQTDLSAGFMLFF